MASLTRVTYNGGRTCYVTAGKRYVLLPVTPSRSKRAYAWALYDSATGLTDEFDSYHIARAHAAELED